MEKTYYSQSGITVTDKRAVIHGKTYAMANVTSVSSLSVKPRTFKSWVALVFFLPCTLLSLFLYFSGAAEGSDSLCTLVMAVVTGGFSLAAIVSIATAKTKHVLRLGSASGEAEALVSQDERHVKEVEAAINQAFVERL